MFAFVAREGVFVGVFRCDGAFIFFSWLLIVHSGSNWRHWWKVETWEKMHSVYRDKRNQGPQPQNGR